ncbi:MAG TPA: DeoR/GlpR family DNA-binding transcription regulator, partial [Limnochordia bacterium]|nr:DeoR/GlpR family DNA-binding transcription regulator [Limnochordia bacterium]
VYGIDRRGQKGITSMLAAERRRRILEQLDGGGYVNNAELARLFGVSVDTIRRDMRILAEERLINRTHGGAMWLDDHEVAFSPKPDPLLSIKRAIAHKALSLVRAKDTIALDAGSTTIQFARALAAHYPAIPVTVITNDFRIGECLADTPHVSVNLTGGRIDNRFYLTGPLTKRVLEILYVDTAFIGTAGLTLESGLTDPAPETAEVKQVLINKAKRVVLITDHTKFGRRQMVHVADIDRIDVVITDEGAPADVLAELRRRRIRTLVV